MKRLFATTLLFIATGTISCGSPDADMMDSHWYSYKKDFQ